MSNLKYIWHPVRKETLKAAIDATLNRSKQGMSLSSDDVWRMCNQLTDVLDLAHSKRIAIIDMGMGGVCRAVVMSFESRFKDYYVMLDPRDMIVASAVIQNIKRVMKDYKPLTGGGRAALKTIFTAIKKHIHLIPVAVQASPAYWCSNASAENVVKSVDSVIKEHSIARDVLLIWPNTRNLDRYAERVEDLLETLTETGDVSRSIFGVESKSIADVLGINMITTVRNEDHSLIPAKPSEGVREKIAQESVVVRIDNSVYGDVDIDCIDLSRVKFIAPLIPVSETCGDELLIFQNRRVTLGNVWYDLFAVGDGLEWYYHRPSTDDQSVVEKTEHLYAPYRLLVNMGDKKSRLFAPTIAGVDTVLKPGRHVDGKIYRDMGIPSAFALDRNNSVFRDIDCKGEDKFVGIFSDEYYLAMCSFLNHHIPINARRLLWVNDGPSLWSQFISINQTKAGGTRPHYLNTCVSTGSRHSEAIAKSVIDNFSQLPNSLNVDVAQPAVALVLGSCVKYNTQLPNLLSQIVRMSETLSVTDFETLKNSCEEMLIQAAKTARFMKRKMAIKALAKAPVVVFNNFTDPYKVKPVSAAILLAVSKFAKQEWSAVALLVDPFFMSASDESWESANWISSEDKQTLARWVRMGRGTPVDAKLAFAANPIAYDARGHYSEYPPVFFAVYATNIPMEARPAALDVHVQVQTEHTPTARVPHSMSRADANEMTLEEPLIRSILESVPAVPPVTFSQSSSSVDAISSPSEHVYAHLEKLISIRTQKLISLTMAINPQASPEDIAEIRRDSEKQAQAVRELALGHKPETAYGPLVIDVAEETINRLSEERDNVQSLIDVSPGPKRQTNVNANDIVLAASRDFLRTIHGRLVSMHTNIISHVYDQDVAEVVKGELYKSAYKGFSRTLAKLEARITAADASHAKIGAVTIDEVLKNQYQPVIASLFNVLQTELRIMEEIKNGSEVDRETYLKSISEFSREFMREVRNFSQKNNLMVKRAKESADRLATFLNSAVFESVREMETFYEQLRYHPGHVIRTGELLDLYLQHKMNDVLEQAISSTKLFVAVASVYMRQLCSSYELLARRKANDVIVASNIKVLGDAPDFAKHVAAIRLGSFLDAHVEEVLRTALVGESEEQAAIAGAPGTPPRQIIRSIDWDVVKNSPMAMDRNREEIAEFLNTYGRFSTKDAVTHKNTFDRFLFCPNPSGPIPIREFALDSDDSYSSGSDSEGEESQFDRGDAVENSPADFMSKTWKAEMDDEVFAFVGSLISRSCFIAGTLNMHLPTERPNLTRWLKSPYLGATESPVHMAYRHLEEGRRMSGSRTVVGSKGGKSASYKRSVGHMELEGKFRLYMIRRYGSKYVDTLMEYSERSDIADRLVKIGTAIDKNGELSLLVDELVVASLLECTTSNVYPDSDESLLDSWHHTLSAMPDWLKTNLAFPFTPESADHRTLRLLDNFAERVPSSMAPYYEASGMTQLVNHFTAETIYHLRNTPGANEDLVETHIRTLTHDINRRSNNVAMHYKMYSAALALLQVLRKGGDFIVPVFRNGGPTAIQDRLARAAYLASNTLNGYLDTESNERGYHVDLDTLGAIHNMSSRLDLNDLAKFLSSTIQSDLKDIQSVMARKVSVCAEGMVSGQSMEPGDLSYEETNSQGYAYLFLIAACNIIRWALVNGIRIAYYDVNQARAHPYRDATLLKLLHSLCNHLVSTMQSYDVPELLCMWADTETRELWMSTSEFFGHRLSKEKQGRPHSLDDVIQGQHKKDEYEKCPASLVELASIDEDKLLTYHYSHNDESYTTMIFVDDFPGKQLDEDQYQSVVALRNAMLPDEIDGALQYEVDSKDKEVLVIAELDTEQDSGEETDQEASASVQEVVADELLGESVFTESTVSISSEPERAVRVIEPKSRMVRKRERSPTEYIAVPGKEAGPPSRSLPSIYDSPSVRSVAISTDTDQPDIVVGRAVADIDPAFVAPPLTKFGVTDVDVMTKRASLGRSSSDIVQDIQRAVEMDNHAIDQFMVHSHAPETITMAQLATVSSPSDIESALAVKVKRRITPQQVLNITGRTVDYSPYRSSVVPQSSISESVLEFN